MHTWVLPAMLGFGLAASAGLRTFLPLLMLAAVSRLGLFGVTLNPHVAWLGSTPALIALGVATAAELAADKIPLVDHGLHAVGTVTRPLAGALAAGAVFSHADPTTAGLAGLIIGAPTALAFHAAQSGARVVSTATTAGMANPLVSLIEDGVAAALAAVAFIAPAAAAAGVAALLFLGFKARAKLRRARNRGSAA